MRKTLALLGLVAALVIPAAAFGNAALNPGNIGEGCDGDGLYHFVARKGSWTDTLNVNFSGAVISTSRVFGVGNNTRNSSIAVS